MTVPAIEPLEAEPVFVTVAVGGSCQHVFGRFDRHRGIDDGSGNGLGLVGADMWRVRASAILGLERAPAMTQIVVPAPADRSKGLVLFGLVEIAVGALAAAVVPLGLLLLLAPGLVGPGLPVAVEARTLLPGLSSYAVVAGVLVTLGVGSIRARRWARSLTLVVAWLWLAAGVMAVGLAWFSLPDMLKGMGVDQLLPAATLPAVELVALGLLGALWIALPGAMILFYRRADVEATCRRRDPQPGWVDRCPPPVLSLAVVWALTGYSVLLMPAYNWVVPFFGVVLHGGTGAALLLPGFVLCLCLAWGSCRVDSRSWWVGMAASTAGALSTLITVVRVDAGQLLAAMAPPADQLALLRSLGLDRRSGLVWLTVVAWASFVLYLLWVKRHFRQVDEGGVPRSQLPSPLPLSLPSNGFCERPADARWRGTEDR